MHASIAAALVLFAALLAVPSRSVAQEVAVDGESLPALLGERGFTPPPNFKLLVVRLDRGADGALSQRHFDWQGTSAERDGWWPASTVKIFAVVAALELLHELGFPFQTWLTYDYADGAVTQRMDQLVRYALEHSSNAAFDRLVEMVGFDEINTEFFVPANGFEDTVFLRAYSGRNRDPETGNGLNRQSPRITLRRGSREHVLPARSGRGTYTCADQGNCTTLRELAEVMRRIMLHEELPDAERYDLRVGELAVIRAALAVARNHEIADIVTRAFGEVPVRVFHKPGFAMEWVSDVLFVHRTDTNERYIVAMAAQPDRRALDQAAQLVGEILASGALRAR